jgi:glycosyltransferase involved in cell wall biosynthesis
VHAGREPYQQLLGDLCSALVIAIPLSRTDGSFGITELNDALALGKPILMTRNPYIDVDIEAVGCGRWIEPGDGLAWREALDRLAGDPAEAAAMGARGRAYAAENWNYERFGRDLVAAVPSAARR